VWDTATISAGHGPILLPTAVTAWTFASDSSAILALDKQGRVTRWQGTHFQHGQPHLDLGSKAYRAVFSPDGRLVAAKRSGETLEIWSLDRCTLAQRIEPQDGPEEPVAFLAEPNRLVTFQRETGGFREYDVATGEELDSWGLGEPGIHLSPVVSPDGQWSLYLDEKGDGHLWDRSAGQEMVLNLNVVPNDQAVFSPDGRLLVVVSWLGPAQVWDTSQGKPITRLRGFLQGQHSVVFTPQGDRLAIGSNAREAVKLWDVATLQEMLTLEGQGSFFGRVAFSPDGNLLASSNGRGLLHIWKAPALEEIDRQENRGR
jgi:WD40 repeat protein